MELKTSQEIPSKNEPQLTSSVDDNSNQKTKKNCLISEVDPHIIKRKMEKERYIWFGVYNELIKNENMIEIISKCKDPSIPIESAAIHLEKYKLAFNKNRTFITYNENNAIFIKLYLITKDQLFDILKSHYDCTETILQDQQIIIETLSKNHAEYILKHNLSNNETQYYDILKCVGELDNISIIALTSSHHEVASPDLEYLRAIYIGLKKSFQPYSEFLIMHYVYLLEGVNNCYTMKQLQEVFLNPKTLTELSSASSETNITIEQANNNQRFLSYHLYKNTPSPDIKESNQTVHCSTGNASPFIETSEKDKPNQYSYILDLNHLPIFDENTGEFFWSNNEANWETARDSIIQSEEIKEKSITINHGGLVFLSNTFSNNIMNSGNKEADADNKNNEEKLLNLKNEVEELNNILKDID